MAATAGVLIKFDPAALADVDRVRGSVPRAVWIKELCAAAVVAHDALAVVPAPVGPRPPEAEIARAAAERSGALWSPSASNPLHQRPIVQKKNGR